MQYFYLCVLYFCILFVSCTNDLEEEKDAVPADSDIRDIPDRIMNLLENGDCEKWYNWESEYLSGWSLRDNHGSVQEECNIVYEGECSAKLSSPKSGITASVSQCVSVSPGHHIRIYFHYYIKNCSGTKPRMYCYFREDSSKNIRNDILSTLYDSNTMMIIRGGGYGEPNFPLNLGEWNLFDYVIQVPAIANCFVFEVHSYIGTTMYIDDCYVVDLDM